jgi:hypothetical protein
MIKDGQEELEWECLVIEWTRMYSRMLSKV